MQRGHRHRLLRRHCCLFLGRSPTRLHRDRHRLHRRYCRPLGIISRRPCPRVLPRSHATQQARWKIFQLFLSRYLLRLPPSRCPLPSSSAAALQSLEPDGPVQTSSPWKKTTVTRPASIINPPRRPLTAASDSAGRVPRQRRPSPGLAWATRALRARARRARARMRVNGRDPPAATGPRGRVARAGLRL